MKAWQAILLTLLIIAIFAYMPWWWFFSPIVVLISAIWGAIDAAQIELKKYKSFLARGPVTVFLGMSLLWIIYFPWYLSFRYKIKHGEATLK